MDKLIYTAMSGAAQAMQQQASVANNLANASTTGFRAEKLTFQALPLTGDGSPTRVFALDAAVGADLQPGAAQQTGRDLDLAIDGAGWLTVETADGSEAFTRNGNLQVNANGVLQTQSGLNVVGEGGPITIPQDAQITIGKDGTVSVLPNGNQRTAVQVVGRLKLVNPPEADLAKGGDGLFHLKSGANADADPAVRVSSGALEGSNVNVVEAMVNMIQLGRQFDMQMKLLTNAQSNASQAAQLLQNF
jgi:flagellar basal-body rod protein FlgF